MNILMFMVPMAFVLGLLFLAAFIWATSRGQFDDLVTPAHRMLLDDTATDSYGKDPIDANETRR